jgi:hypothetical protein
MHWLALAFAFLEHVPLFRKNAQAEPAQTALKKQSIFCFDTTLLLLPHTTSPQPLHPALPFDHPCSPVLRCVKTLLVAMVGSGFCSGSFRASSWATGRSSRIVLHETQENVRGPKGAPLEGTKFSFSELFIHWTEHVLCSCHCPWKILEGNSCRHPCKIQHAQDLPNSSSMIWRIPCLIRPLETKPLCLYAFTALSACFITGRTAARRLTCRTSAATMPQFQLGTN